jgi:hypothetical protein
MACRRCTYEQVFLCYRAAGQLAIQQTKFAGAIDGLEAI